MIHLLNIIPVYEFFRFYTTTFNNKLREQIKNEKSTPEIDLEGLLRNKTQNPLTLDYKVNGLIITTTSQGGPAIAAGANLGETANKFILINQSFMNLDCDATKFIAKHEFGHIVCNHTLKIPLVMLIYSITISIILPKFVSWATSYLVNSKTEIQSGSLLPAIRGIGIKLINHSLYTKFCSSEYAKLTLALISLIFIKMICQKRFEADADDFALKHSTPDEIRGGIRYMLAEQENIDYVINILPFGRFIPDFIFGPFHPSAASRCEKFKTAYLKESTYEYEETPLDKTKIRKLAKALLDSRLGI